MGKVQISYLAKDANTWEYEIGCSLGVEVENKEVSIRTDFFDLGIHQRLRHCQRNLASVCLRLSLDPSIEEEVVGVGRMVSIYTFSFGMYFLMVVCVIPSLIFCDCLHDTSSCVIQGLDGGSFARSVLPTRYSSISIVLDRFLWNRSVSIVPDVCGRFDDFGILNCELINGSFDRDASLTCVGIHFHLYELLS